MKNNRSRWLETPPPHAHPGIVRQSRALPNSTAAARRRDLHVALHGEIVGQEDYVYVWTLGTEGVGDEQDKLVTIVSVNPASPKTMAKS